MKFSVRVTRGHGSVLLVRHCNLTAIRYVLPISWIVIHMFSHTGAYADNYTELRSLDVEANNA